MWKKAQDFLSKDKIIGSLIKKYGSCQIAIRHHDNYFIDLVDAIVSQQLSIKAAATIYKRLTDKLSGDITPQNILALQDQEIRDCGISWAKIKYIKDLSQRTLDGRLKANELDKLTDEEVSRELTAVRGIGQWTADMFLMFTLARADVFPIGDLGIRNGLRKLLNNQELNQEQMVEMSQSWKPYRTVASWYIWKSLDNT
ncbi:MAG: DNA-3-methyladenine glycosylase [Patescibacteria group bacterium]